MPHFKYKNLLFCTYICFLLHAQHPQSAVGDPPLLPLGVQEQTPPEKEPAQMQQQMTPTILNELANKLIATAEEQPSDYGQACIIMARHMMVKQLIQPIK